VSPVALEEFMKMEEKYPNISYFPLEEIEKIVVNPGAFSLE